MMQPSMGNGLAPYANSDGTDFRNFPQAPGNGSLSATNNTSGNGQSSVKRKGVQKIHTTGLVNNMI